MVTIELRSEQLASMSAGAYAVRSGGPGPVVVPKGRYIDTAYAQLEQERLWPRVWQMAGLAADVETPGHWVEYRVGDQSFIVLRDLEGVLRAFHNVCSHRGFQLCSGSGSCADGTLQCGYHGWRYDLDGAVREITSQRGFGTIDRAEFSLRRVHVDSWAGLVFVNPALEPSETLAEFLGVLPDDLAMFALDQRTCAFRCTVTMAGNWKVTVDAFNEVYHLQGLHPQLMPFMDDVHTTYRVFDHGHSMMQIPLGVASPRLGGRTEEQIAAAFHDCYTSMLGPKPAGELDLGAQTARDYAVAAIRDRCAHGGLDLASLRDDQVLDDFHYLAFPNVVFNVHSEMHTVFRARPGATPHTSFFDFYVFHRLPPAGNGLIDGHRKGPQDHVEFPEGARVSEVLDQDLDGVARVHAGLRSAGIDHVVFADFECRLAAMHRELDRYVG